MNNFKIIETSALLPDVLLYRHRDENGKEFVKILAIGNERGIEDIFVGESAEFESPESAKQFIKDFSVNSAEAFCKRENIKY